ncbi:MAG: thioredoxin [Candidatus Woesearchaeota archaeon]|nr:thioredoxin [Candidatus Woesearchaeota archaeon]
MITYLTKENFVSEVNKSDIPVLIDFWASWCMPCQIMAPVFEDVAKEYDGLLKFVKLSTEEMPEMASAYGVQSIPSLVLVYKNREIERLVGYMPKPVFKASIEQLIKKHPEIFKK